jgi:hypothetical protein
VNPTFGLLTQILEDGFAIVKELFSHEQVCELIATLEKVDKSEAVRSRGGMFAVRNLLDISPEIRALV